MFHESVMFFRAVWCVVFVGSVDFRCAVASVERVGSVVFVGS